LCWEEILGGNHSWENVLAIETLVPRQASVFHDEEELAQNVSIRTGNPHLPLPYFKALRILLMIFLLRETLGGRATLRDSVGWWHPQSLDTCLSAGYWSFDELRLVRQDSGRPPTTTAFCRSFRRIFGGLKGVRSSEE